MPPPPPRKKPAQGGRRASAVPTGESKQKSPTPEPEGGETGPAQHVDPNSTAGDGDEAKEEPTPQKSAETKDDDTSAQEASPGETPQSGATDHRDPQWSAAFYEGAVAYYEKNKLDSVDKALEDFAERQAMVGRSAETPQSGGTDGKTREETQTKEECSVQEKTEENKQQTSGEKKDSRTPAEDSKESSGGAKEEGSPATKDSEKSAPKDEEQKKEDGKNEAAKNDQPTDEKKAQEGTPQKEGSKSASASSPPKNNGPPPSILKDGQTSETDTYHVGWMEKCAIGRSGGGNWKKRFFTLDKLTGNLKYWEAQSDAIKCGAMGAEHGKPGGSSKTPKGTVKLLPTYDAACNVQLVQHPALTKEVHAEFKYRDRDLLIQWDEPENAKKSDSKLVPRKLLLRCSTSREQDGWCSAIEVLLQPPEEQSRGLVVEEEPQSASAAPAEEEEKQEISAKEEQEEVAKEEEEEEVAEEEPEPAKTTPVPEQAEQPEAPEEEKEEEKETPPPPPPKEEQKSTPVRMSAEVEAFLQEVGDALQQYLDEVTEDEADLPEISLITAQNAALCHICGRAILVGKIARHNRFCSEDLSHALKVIQQTPSFGLINQLPTFFDQAPYLLPPPPPPPPKQEGDEEDEGQVILSEAEREARERGVVAEWGPDVLHRYNVEAAEQFLNAMIRCKACGEQVPLSNSFKHLKEEGQCTRTTSTVTGSPLRVRYPRQI